MGHPHHEQTTPTNAKHLRRKLHRKAHLHMRRHHEDQHGPRRRGRRGIVGEATLLVLADGPLHGYDIINELENRSGGRWRPSPGAMYPALGRLEEKGFITGEATDDGKRRYSITEAGRERIARRDADAPLPWEEDGGRPGGELRPLVAEVSGQLRQIGKFGSDEQRDQAKAILLKAKADLYQVLAQSDD